MTRIDPIQWTEKTALRERDQLRTAVNMLIESINGTAGDADRAEQAAIAAKTQAELAAHDANDAKASAEQAAIEAGKVNQFDARIKGNMKDVSYAPTATEVTALIMKEDGTIIDRPIPTLDHDRAGMMTPAQMKDITDELDSHGTQINALDRGTVKIDGDQRVKGTKTFDMPKTYNRAVETITFDDVLNAFNVASLIAGAVTAYQNANSNTATTHTSMTVFGTASFRDSVMPDPAVTVIGYVFNAEAFRRSNIKTLKTTALHTFTSITAFSDCPDLETVDMMGWEDSFSRIFQNDVKLNALISRNPIPPKVSAVNFLENTGISNGTGYIYVPADSLTAYKTAPNWSAYADRMMTLEDIPPEAQI